MILTYKINDNEQVTREINVPNSEIKIFEFDETHRLDIIFDKGYMWNIFFYKNDLEDINYLKQYLGILFCDLTYTELNNFHKNKNAIYFNFYLCNRNYSVQVSLENKYQYVVDLIDIKQEIGNLNSIIIPKLKNETDESLLKWNHLVLTKEESLELIDKINMKFAEI